MTSADADDWADAERRACLAVVADAKSDRRETPMPASGVYRCANPNRRCGSLLTTTDFGATKRRADEYIPTWVRCWKCGHRWDV